MSAFGGYGNDDAFEDEDFGEPGNQHIDQSTEPVAPAEPEPVEVYRDPNQAFDDEDDFGSPLDQSVVQNISQVNHLPTPQVVAAKLPATASFNQSIIHAALNSTSNPLALPSSPSTIPKVTNQPANQSIYQTTNQSLEESRLSLEILHALPSVSDPAIYSNQVYQSSAVTPATNQSIQQLIKGQTEVSVIDPEKKSDALSSYIVYKVRTVHDASGDQSSKTPIQTLHNPSVRQTVVVRRYSDFLWLHDCLFVSPDLAGFLIPPVPDKAVMGRFGEDFIEERRRILELFLKRVIAHPAFMAQDEVKSFLYAEKAAWTAARKQTRKVTIAGLPSSGGVLGVFKKQGPNKLPSQRHAAASPDDMLCEKAEDYAAKFEAELQNFDAQIGEFMTREKSMARSWVEFGQSCGLISQMEAAVNEKTNVSIFGTLGSMSDQVAVMLARKVELERQGLRDAVRDHVRLAESVQNMMKLRGILSSNYLEALQKLEALQRKGAQGKQLQEAQQVLNARQQELLECTNRARVEFGRFQKEKARALKQAAIHFVQLQIEQAKQTQAAWENIIGDIMQQPTI